MRVGLFGNSTTTGPGLLMMVATTPAVSFTDEYGVAALQAVPPGSMFLPQNKSTVLCPTGMCSAMLCSLLTAQVHSPPTRVLDRVCYALQAHMQNIGVPSNVLPAVTVTLGHVLPEVSTRCTPTLLRRHSSRHHLWWIH